MPGPCQHPGVDHPPVIELLAALIAIPSVNPGLEPGGAGEAGIAAFVAAWCRDAGAEVTVLESVPGRPSVVARVRGRGRGPRLLLNAHLDTVGVAGMSDPFVPRIADGMIRGRGAADTKAGLAACMLALRAAAEADAPGEVVLAAVADEELDSLGTEQLVNRLRADHQNADHLRAEHLRAEHLRADHRRADHLRLDEGRFDGCVVLEPTSMELCVAHRGFAVHEVELRGRRSHTSQPHLGVNALSHLGNVLDAVAAFDAELAARPPHPLLGRSLVQPVLATGGTELFTTPASASVHIERRTLPGERAEVVERDLDAVLARAGQGRPGWSVTKRLVARREPLETPSDAWIVGALGDAAAGVLGRRPRLVGAPFWTDAALTADLGIPSVVFGPTPHDIHGTQERASIDEVVDLAAVMASLVTRC